MHNSHNVHIKCVSIGKYRELTEIALERCDLDLNVNPDNLDWIISFISILFLCCPKSYFKRIPVFGVDCRGKCFWLGLSCFGLYVDLLLGFFFLLL